MPDLTLLLDMPPRDADARLRRELDRMEVRGDDYREKLRKGFLDEAAKAPEQIVVVDAAGTVTEVQQRVLQSAARLL